MRYYIIAGEASGDLHAANLVKELSKLDNHAQFRGWGGDKMELEGVELVRHYRELAFMGFTEVIMNLRTILKNIEVCKKDILDFHPDVLILVDYPGFNLRIASFAKEKGIRVFYYISPQVWAWKQSRVYAIRKNVERMFVILPFEKDFYSRFDYAVDFVGHPLLDALEERKKNIPARKEFLEKNSLPDKPVIAVLPGSRNQEIRAMLPLMQQIRKDFPEYEFIVAGAPSLSINYYQQVLPGKNLRVLENQTYDLLSHSVAALVTSGTATLETALLGIPEVVCYKGGRLSYMIARALVKIRFISLVNLIMDREVVCELIQDELNVTRLKEELKAILEPLQAEKMKNDFRQLRQKLGGSGASVKAASLMYAYLNEPVN